MKNTSPVRLCFVALSGIALLTAIHSEKDGALWFALSLVWGLCALIPGDQK